MVSKPEPTEPRHAISKRRNAVSRKALKYAAILLVIVGPFRIGVSGEQPAALDLSPVPARTAVPREQREATATEGSRRRDAGAFEDLNANADGGYTYYENE